MKDRKLKINGVRFSTREIESVTIRRRGKLIEIERPAKADRIGYRIKKH